MYLTVLVCEGKINVNQEIWASGDKEGRNLWNKCRMSVRSAALIPRCS